MSSHRSCRDIAKEEESPVSVPKWSGQPIASGSLHEAVRCGVLRNSREPSYPREKIHGREL